MSYGQYSNINLISFPIDELNGGFRNLFRGFVENNIELQLNDCVITSIVENSGKITIATSSTNALMIEDNIITIVGGIYDGKSGLITTDSNPVYEVDIDFIGNETNVNGFINRVDNGYKMEFRFVNSTTQDVQSGIEVLGNQTFFNSNDISGIFNFDISLLSNLFEPTFEVIDSSNSKMNKNFQLQLREYENGASIGNWFTIYDTSLTAFELFILCHSTGNVSQYDYNNKLMDIDLNSRIWKGYDKIVNFLATDANATLTNYNFYQKEYKQDSSFIANNTIVKSLNNGVNAFTVNINSSLARYLTLTDSLNNSSLNLTIYDTNLDDTEYYFTWISEEGSFRNWLFNARNERTNSFDTIQTFENSFRKIPIDSSIEISLQTLGLNVEEFKYVISIFGSNLIKVENNNTVYECILNDETISYINKNNNYDLTFDIQLKPKQTMKV